MGSNTDERLCMPLQWQQTLREIHGEGPPGAAPDAVKAARPVLNGGREATCRKVTRLAPTQHHRTGARSWPTSLVAAKTMVFLQLKALLEPFGLARYYTDHWGTYTRHLDPDMHSPGKQMSLSRLNHWLPGREAHPEVVQGTTEFHYEITNSLLPQAAPVFDDAAALDTAVHMLNP